VAFIEDPTPELSMHHEELVLAIDIKSGAKYTKSSRTVPLLPFLKFLGALVHLIIFRKYWKLENIFMSSSQSLDHCPSLNRNNEN
jgi:hypothetical protein